jgi:hypothetical protein
MTNKSLSSKMKIVPICLRETASGKQNSRSKNSNSVNSFHMVLKGAHIRPRRSFGALPPNDISDRG